MILKERLIQFNKNTRQIPGKVVKNEKKRSREYKEADNNTGINNFKNKGDFNAIDK